MSEARARQEPTPICPRCGYDQSGVIATWREACPLRGLCSECGLDYECSTVLGAAALGPRWSVEHGRRLTFGRLARAWWRGMVQRRLWRDFDLAYPIKPRRLWALALAGAAMHHLFFAGAISLGHTLELALSGWSAQQPWAASVWLLPYDDALSLPIGPSSTVEIDAGPMALLIGCTLVVPALVLLIFTQTMSRVGVRRSHVLRGFAYMTPATGPVAFTLLALLGALVVAEGPSASGGLLSAAASLAILLSWPLWQALRWRSFVKHYLRLPHANWIALSMLVILGLVFVASVVLISTWLGVW
jgi:hypothetical protein